MRIGEAGGNSTSGREPLSGALRLPLRHEMGERAGGEVGRLEISPPARERGLARCATPLSSSPPVRGTRGPELGRPSGGCVKCPGALPIRLANPALPHPS
jgi:hypothetical protein